MRFGTGGDAVGGENLFQSLFAEDLDSLEMGFAVLFVALVGIYNRGKGREIETTQCDYIGIRLLYASFELKECFHFKLVDIMKIVHNEP